MNLKSPCWCFPEVGIGSGRMLKLGPDHCPLCLQGPGSAASQNKLSRLQLAACLLEICVLGQCRLIDRE